MEPLVRRLGYVALDVRDLDTAIEDAISISGVRLIERRADHAILSANRSRAELVLHRAKKDGVHAIGMEATSLEALTEIGIRARKAGLKILSEKPALDFTAAGLAFITREGHVIEAHMPIPEDQPRRYVGAGIHPSRICHVNLASTNPFALHTTLGEVLGMRLSERTEGCELMWLRAGDGRHHSIGIAKSATSGLHHFAWEFAQFSDFMRLGDTLDAQGRLIVWGPGRHGCGDNLFAYYVDSAGFLVECSAEMEIILDDRPAKVISCPPDLSNIKVVNRWGAPPPREWIEHHSPFSPR